MYTIEFFMEIPPVIVLTEKERKMVEGHFRAAVEELVRQNAAMMYGVDPKRLGLPAPKPVQIIDVEASGER